jgi:hypothetical protein
MRANVPIYLNCVKRFPLDFTVFISVEKVSSQWGDNCTFQFGFADHGILALNLGISAGKAAIPVL